MAKRVPPSDKPYEPVNAALAQSVLQHRPLEGGAPSPAPPPSTPAPRKVAEVREPGPAEDAGDGKPAEDETEQVPKFERLDREKRLLLSKSEEREFERLVSEMAEQLGTPLKPSHVLRAVMTLLLNADEELAKQCGKVGFLKRPPNGDLAALAVFEHSMARIIDIAFRNTKPLE